MKSHFRQSCRPFSACAAAVAVVLSVLAMSLPSAAAPGWLMKLDGVDGWAPVARATAGLSPATDAQAASLTLQIFKIPDKSSPLLLKNCGDGSAVRRLTLAWQDGGATLFRITLENVMIQSFSATLEPGSAPQEEFAMICQKAEWSYFGPDEAASVLGGTGARVDLLTQQATAKTYLPFRATLEKAIGQPGLRLTCPVEAGRTYRISASTSLDGKWDTLEDFRAAEDGPMERHLSSAAGRLFLRVEALD